MRNTILTALLFTQFTAVAQTPDTLYVAKDPNTINSDRCLTLESENLILSQTDNPDLLLSNSRRREVRRSMKRIGAEKLMPDFFTPDTFEVSHVARTETEVIYRPMGSVKRVTVTTYRSPGTDMLEVTTVSKTYSRKGRKIWRRKSRVTSSVW